MELLGEGASGAVYRAVDRHLSDEGAEATVAIKVFSVAEMAGRSRRELLMHGAAYAGGILASWTFIAIPLRRESARLGALTLPDYLEARFGAHNRALRLVAALVILMSSLLYLVAIFKGAGNLFERFLGIPYQHAVGLTLVIVPVVYATIEAEEQGIDSMNVGEFAGGDNPVVARLLGEEGELGSALGIADDFVVSVISAVGNYGEIYDRAFGPETALAISRDGTVNDLWTNGGLMYSPPFR